MDCLTVLQKARQLGLTLTPDGENLSVKGPKTPAVVDFLATLKAHKSELLVYLAQRRRAEEIAASVKKEGCCLFFAGMFNEMVAFIRDDSFRDKVPAGVVVYTREEIGTLWAADGPSDAQLRLIHAGKKKAGARVVSGPQEETR